MLRPLLCRITLGHLFFGGGGSDWHIMTAARPHVYAIYIEGLPIMPAAAPVVSTRLEQQACAGPACLFVGGGGVRVGTP
jgi:hypothetical protein